MTDRHAKWKRIAQFAKRWQNVLMACLLLVLVAVGCRLWPHRPLQAWLPSSTAVYDARGRLMRLTLASDDRYRLWVPLSDMSPQMVEAVQLHEDRWFRWHPGFNPFGLVRGAWVTYVRHGDPQGGSTLTMQLARLLWRLNTRTPGGKLVQIARAMQLELFYSKRDILEAYLNYAPYGRNVEGVAAASLIYFDHQPASLSLPEALTLAVVPQDPTRRLRALPGADAPTGIINKALASSRDRLYARWIHQHPQDERLRPLFALPLNLRLPGQLPFEAPHAVEQELAARSRLGAPLDSRVHTTIDLDLQHVLERQIGRYIERNDARGIRNAAAILVDTRDLSVRAMVGSAGYGNAAIQGQVNGTLAKRSPGSTLKPFIYALGFDQGVLHPQTVLRDVPTSFGPYAPENFDGHFLGPVTATEALIRSRNIPAVWVAAQLKSPDFYQFLRDAGISRMASEQHYGLALVLGGGEVTMQELAGLYAMLANRGELKPLRLDASDPQGAGTRMLSDEASFMVMDMLRQNPRPDETFGAQPGRLPVYWKTGTSWGFRDAWTAGSFGPYVLVVWIGNFDGSGNPAFVGVEAAAPLFFQIVDAMRAQDARMTEPVRHMPGNLRRVEICLASGDLPNEWCPQRGKTWFIPGKSPIRVSQVHRALVMDDATGKPACPPLEGKRTHLEVYEFWPSELQQVFIQAGMPRRVPPRNDDCVQSGIAVGDPPRMTSPLRGSIYALRLRDDDSRRIALTADADAAVRNLYWFVNDAYVGSSAPGQPLFWEPPSPGNYDVRVVDDRGMSDHRGLGVTRVE
ncbi:MULTISPECIES: penicillin-binding protein 1C [Dyella]|uniref:peptidoglycan glycosyltransferase n=2 Tax=Dyella TaxID=231454 RepID=A0A4R0YWZ9_9GAMM|nr:MULTISPECIES: penicillin-binding protein 1C [Dyella]TBR39311.1 penicillin-binding protein 1C [Dyella terrae]TCI13101.1 penicillin-binding protein 1C [Dyella soli]